MHKFLTAAVALLAAGMMLAGSGSAQTQAPAAKPSTAPATSASKAPAKKATTTKATEKKEAEPAALTTRTDKFSYALGMNIGSNLKRQSVEVDPKLLAQGLQDAIAGSTTRLSEQEAGAVLQEVQNEVRKTMQEKAAQVAATNKSEGEAFLAANKSKEGVVTLPSGLQYKILTAGTGPKPTAADTVVCNYRGTLINGTEFDSSYKRGQPATFPVGQVIKGWTEALQLMPVGSKWQLFIPSGLAYGERGAGGDIGPDATLIFEVELLSIQEKNKEQKPEAAKPEPAKPEATKPEAAKPETAKPEAAKPEAAKPEDKK